MQNGTRGNETSFVTGKPLGADRATRFVMFGDMCECCGGRGSGVSRLADASLLLSDISSGEGAAATCKSLTQRITGADDLDFLIHVGDVRA